MNTEEIKLSQISINAANPRVIKDIKFEKLITSLLALPKMLELRPIVVDNTMTILGGNMRYRALRSIADMDDAAIRAKLEASKDYQSKTQAERDMLVDYWLAWKDNPTAKVINAASLSDAEKREFIIKDNVSFGNWDFDALANEWDVEDLDDWGVDLPIAGSEINIDDFFDNMDSNGETKLNEEKLIITIPDEYAAQKDDIKTLIETTLTEYKGCKIK